MPSGLGGNASGAPWAEHFLTPLSQEEHLRCLKAEVGYAAVTALGWLGHGGEFVLRRRRGRVCAAAWADFQDDPAADRVAGGHTTFDAADALELEMDDPPKRRPG